VDEGHVNIPAANAPSLICLDKATGKALWTDKSPGTDIMHEQFSTPLVAAINGRTQVIVGQGDGWLRSFEAETGKLIWKCDLNAKGLKYDLGGRGRRSYVMATPVYYDGRVYIAIGQSPEHFDGEGRLSCIDPTGTGDVSAELDDGRGGRKPNPNSSVVWHYGGPAPIGSDRDWLFGRTMANCVAHEGLVYICDIAGFVYCFDAKTGRLYWQDDLKASAWGGPLWVDGKVYFATEDGDVFVYAAGKEKKLLATVEMGYGTNVIRVAPVFANGVLYVMSHSVLYAIQSPK
jgi:outer membrane protein assembly factor BamB